MSLNLATILSDSAKKYPERVAIVSENQTYSFNDLLLWSKKVAETLAAFGVKKGDHIAMMIPNVPEFTVVYFGILMLGAIVVPVNIMLLEDEISYLLDHSDAYCFLAWSTFAERSFLAFQNVEECKHLFFLGESAQQESDARQSISDNPPLALDPFLENQPGTLETVLTSPNDTAVILYTSGTTGRPKGAELSHFNMYSNAFYVALHCFYLTPDDTGLGVLPLYHSFGQTAMQNALIIAGGKIVLVPQFEPKKALAQIEKWRVTYISAVPTMYHLLAQHQKRVAANTDSLRLIISGGASLPVALGEEFEKVFHIPIYEGYGLSETSPVTNTSYFPGKANRSGSIGPSILGTESEILRSDGSPAEPEEIGEVAIRGHNLMKGYYKDPLATQAVMHNTWFRTGDIGKKDVDGYFYILDRKKDVIIRAGMNIYPREIEEILLRHPAVKEASVIGIQDDTLSENVVAFIVLKDAVECTAELLLRYCRNQLAAFKCPKTIHFLESLPKGPTGKILKRELRPKRGKE